MEAPQILRAITVLPVKDIDQSVVWYKQVLGFELLFLNEGDHPAEKTNYAVLERDGVPLHLILDEGSQDQHLWTKAGSGYLYLIAHNIDGLYERVQGTEVDIPRPLQREVWGAKGFNLIDPSGNEVHMEESAQD